MFNGTKIFLIIDCKLIYLSLLEICYLWYCRSLCIMNGYFYFKKNCFLHMAFKCLSLWSQWIKSIGVQSKSGISPCGYVGSQMDKDQLMGSSVTCHGIYKNLTVPVLSVPRHFTRKNLM